VIATRDTNGFLNIGPYVWISDSQGILCYLTDPNNPLIEVVYATLMWGSSSTSNTAPRSLYRKTSQPEHFGSRFRLASLQRRDAQARINLCSISLSADERYTCPDADCGLIRRCYRFGMNFVLWSTVLLSGCALVGPQSEGYKRCQCKQPELGRNSSFSFFSVEVWLVLVDPPYQIRESGIGAQSI
jgi:hypothetical protein